MDRRKDYKTIKIRTYAYERARRIAFAERRPIIDVMTDALLAHPIIRRRDAGEKK